MSLFKSDSSQGTLPASGRWLAAALMGSALTAASVNAWAAGNLRIGIQSEPSSLVPAEVNGTIADGDVLNDLYEGLTTVDASGEVIPGAASGWKVSDDGKRYTFTLRKDARWSDGKPVIAEDFVSGFRAALNPQSPSVYAALLYPLKNAQAIASNKAELSSLGIKAQGEHTVVIELNQPTPYLPALLTNSVASPIPSHLVRSAGQSWKKVGTLVTNGAFSPKQWIPHDHLTAVKNRYFHDAKHVSLDQVTYIPVEDENAATQRFRAGEFDIVRAFAANQYKRLKSQLGDELKLSPELDTYYFALNQRKGQPTADKRVREALNLGINRSIIADKIMQGTVLPAKGFVPPGVQDYQGASMPGLDAPFAKRQQHARELLKEAGYSSDHPLTITLNYNRTEINQPIAVAMGAMWKAIGVNTKFANTEANVHYSNLAAGHFGVGRATWLGDYDDANTFLAILESGNAKNYGHYHSTTYDQLMDKANGTTNVKARSQGLHKAEAQALSDYAMLPLYYDAARNLVSNEVHGWKANTINRHLARWESLGSKGSSDSN